MDLGEPISLGTLLLTSLLSGTLGALIVQTVPEFVTWHRRRRALAGTLLLETMKITEEMKAVLKTLTVGVKVLCGPIQVAFFSAHASELVNLFPARLAAEIGHFYDRVSAFETIQGYLRSLPAPERATPENGELLRQHAQWTVNAFPVIETELQQLAARNVVRFVESVKAQQAKRGVS